MAHGSSSQSPDDISVPLAFLTELAEAASADDLYRAISDWLPRLFVADQITIVLRKSGDTLHRVAVAGDTTIFGDTESYPIEGSNVGHCLQSRQPLIIDDLTEEQPPHPSRTALTGAPLGSIAILPLIAAGNCIGTVNFACRAAGMFGPDVVARMLPTAAWLASQISHHAALEQVSATQARFDAVTRNTSSIMFAKDRAGRIVIANRAYCEAFGFDAEDVIGVPDSDLFGAEVAARWRLDEHRILDTGIPETINDELVLADGSLRFLIVQKFPIYDAVSREYLVCGISNDITEQKLTERALRESEERFRAFFENSTSVMYFKDTDRIFRYANHEFLAVSGVAPDHVIGKAAIDDIEPAEFDMLRRYDDAVIHSNDVIREEVRLTFGDSEPREFIVTKFPVHNADGETIGIGGINTDISDLRTRERELAIAKSVAELNARVAEKAALQAQDADRAKSDFLASMSHEIRTPLTAILGLAGVLLDGGLGSKQEDQVRAIRESGAALMSILNDILDLSKIEAGALALENVDFRLADLLNQIETLWRPHAIGKGLRWSTEIYMPLAPRLHTDETRLRQVLYNLVSNAIKFTEAGEVSLTVDQTDRGNGLIETRFRISDTGPGIPSELGDKLFRKFSQIDSSIARRYGGTGLGLAISKSLVEMMAGQIGFETAPGKGSMFWFTITCPPAQAAIDSAETRGRFEEQVPARAGAAGRLRILIAEDNVVNQKMICAMLESSGHLIDCVSNGIEAVAAVAGVPYDLVLMDIQMPEMDGITATRHIRALPGPESSVPIVAITAYAMAADLERYVSAGINGHVAKPLEASTLKEAIARHAGP